MKGAINNMRLNTLGLISKIKEEYPIYRNQNGDIEHDSDPIFGSD